MGQCFHQNGNCFRNFVPSRLFTTWAFPIFYFDLLNNEIEVEHATQPAKKSIR